MHSADYQAVTEIFPDSNKGSIEGINGNADDCDICFYYKKLNQIRTMNKRITLIETISQSRLEKLPRAAEGKAPVAEDINWEEKAKELARLLLEARDMLFHITMVTAKLNRLDLTLANRIEASLEPWKVEG